MDKTHLNSADTTLILSDKRQKLSYVLQTPSCIHTFSDVKGIFLYRVKYSLHNT